jgi:hypothetical protein
MTDLVGITLRFEDEEMQKRLQRDRVAKQDADILDEVTEETKLS